jgi:hypothetical protein
VVLRAIFCHDRKTHSGRLLALNWDTTKIPDGAKHERMSVMKMCVANQFDKTFEVEITEDEPIQLRRVDTGEIIPFKDLIGLPQYTKYHVIASSVSPAELKKLQASGLYTFGALPVKREHKRGWLFPTE